MAFRALLGQKDEVENQFGERLDWQELPGRNASRIAIFHVGVDSSQEAQYPDLHRWMLDKMDRFRAVFTARVQELSLVPTLDAADDELLED